jgi:alpha-beta hydrolase superfamily lysophospholipase
MGGLVTVSFLLRNPALRVAGVILTSPLLGLPLGKQVNWAKLKFLEFLGD